MDQELKLIFNDEQLENLEMVLLEAKESLPDDEQQFIDALPNSYAGTIRNMLEQMAKQTNRGVAPSEYMNCEV